MQANLTLYCWGGRRSGALEHVLERYGWTHSSQLHRINSKLVSPEQWLWLKQIFVTVHRMFDEKETGDTVSKIHWLNVVDCRLAYDLLRKECYHYHRHLYPAGSSLGIYLKHHGVEVEGWYYSLTDEEDAPSSTANSDSQHSPSTPSSAHHRQQLTDNDSLSSSGSSSNQSNVVWSDAVLPSPLSRDLRSATAALGEYEWLSDVHIANLMFLLLHGQLQLPLEYRDHFQCIYPMTDDLFIQMLQRSEPGSLLMHAKSGQGVTMVFINPHNNHWRLIILDGLQQQIVLFDPLGTPLPSSLVSALCEFMGSSYQLIDLQLCLQAENWNCGVWSLYIASRYITAAVDHLTLGSANVDSEEDDHHHSICSYMDFKRLLLQSDAEFVVLDEHTQYSQRYQNKLFAGELRNQYSILLAEAAANGRLLYTLDVDVDGREATEEEDR